LIDRCSKTSKKQFQSKFDATLFQSVLFPNRLIRIYLCPYCHFYHVTTQKLSTKRIATEAIKLIQSQKSKPIKSISNDLKVHEVEIGGKVFVVIYNKERKKITKFMNGTTL